MVTPLLEVIVLDAADAGHARDGGADRVELVSDMAAAGLSPSPATVAAVRAAVDLPVRVMLRARAGFAVGDVDALRRTAKELRSAGATEFVLGFLDAGGAVDLPAVAGVLAVLDGAAWTFHRAIDHVTTGRAAAWAALAGLPGLDTVLTAGAPTGLPDGLPTVLAEVSGRDGFSARDGVSGLGGAGGGLGGAGGGGGGVVVLVGGGLRDEHVGPLRAAGVVAFHSGSAVRPGRTFAAPVDPALVRGLRDRIDGH